MKVRRVVLGALAGTFLSFMWINLSWTVFGLHNSAIRAFPDPEPVVAALKAQNVDGGIYVIPHLDAAAYSDKEAMAVHTKKMVDGPYMMGVVRSGSMDSPPEMGFYIARGAAIQLIAGLIVAILLAAAAPNLNYIGRFVFVLMLGVFAGVTGHLPNWNWWYYPADFTMAEVVDSVVSWGLAGLAMAAIIKPSAPPASA